MAVKSVIEVEIDDGAFKTFKALFDKFKEQAAELPGVWAEVGKETKASASSFDDMVAALMAQAHLMDALEKKRKAERKLNEREVSNWKRISTYSKEVAGNIGKATTALLKWGSLTGIVSGLVGAGGLYGIDRLALGVGAGRRSSLGLGLGYGEQKSFDTNFGRIVDSNAFLGGVNEALHDVTKRWTLQAAGVKNASIAGGDTGAVGVELLNSVKALVDKTPANQLQQLSDSRGLGQFYSLQDLVRLKATSREELSTQGAAFRRDAGSFGLDDRTQRRFQDFATQLSRAGQKIETVFVQGLDPLVPSLSKLSDSVANALKSFLEGIKPKDVEALGKNIEDFAKYLGSADFKKSVRDFASDVGELARTISDALRSLGKHSVQDAAFGAAAGGALGGVPGAAVGGVVGGAVGDVRDQIASGKLQGYDHDTLFGRVLDFARKRTWQGPNESNPGNIRPTSGNGYLKFSSPEEGVRAVANQLLRYEYSKKWGGLDTIAKIVATYAPAKDGNNVGAYIKDVVGQTGFKADQHLDLSDKSTLAKLTSAILKHENRSQNGKYTPDRTLQIINNTGGNATVVAAQAAR